MDMKTQSDQAPPAYQPPAPEQAFNAYPQVQQPIPAVIVPQGNVLTEYPVNIVCPKCQQQVVTNVGYVNGLLTWILVIVILLIFFPLACVPCCVDACKDVEHYCPKCNAMIGVKKRIN